MMHKEKLYNPVVDVLRVISILAVIIIHTTTRTLEATSFDLLDTPWTLFLNQIFRFAVPMFFLISGFALQLNYPFHANYLTYLKKRLSRILVPYIFWSVAYYFFVYTNHTTSVFQAILEGNASYQLYFIPAILLFYIVFPIIHKYFHFVNNIWVMMILSIFQLSLLYYNYHTKELPFYYPVSVALLNFYIFILGVFAARHHQKLFSLVKKWRTLIAFIVIGLAGYIYWQGMSLYLATNNYLFFYSQWRPAVFLYTIVLGGLCYYIFNRKIIYGGLIKKIASLSFFVFFVHVIVLEWVWISFGKVIIELTQGRVANQLWFDPAFFLVVAAISFLLAYIIHKIPKLSKISG